VNVVKGKDEATTYTFQSAYESKPYTSGYIHHVTVTDLKPETKYSYQCGDSTTMSATFAFTTPPQVGPTAPFRFGVMGDMGQTNNSAATMQHIISGGYSATLLVGDLSYADSAWKPGMFGPCSQTRWDSWGKLVEPLAANCPLMVLPGNHEVEQDGAPPATQTEFMAYQARMAMPAEASGAKEGNLYYSFEIGAVHFIMVNSYGDYNATSAQYKWLAADLKAVDRSKTPWLVASMHAPWYNSNVKHHDEIQETGMRDSMEPMLLDAKVDLIFAGHVHAYERTFAVANNKTTAGAPIHINIGDAGNREGPCPDYYPQPEWSAFRESKFGHGEMAVHNATHLQWNWHRVVDDEPVSADSVWLVKGSDGIVAAHGAGASASVYDGYQHLLNKKK